MSKVTRFPDSRAADAFTTNYWFLSNPAQPDIEPIRAVHDELSFDELMSVDIEGCEMALFLPVDVVSYLQLPEQDRHLVRDPEGNKRECSLVGPFHMKWGGNLTEQAERDEYPDATPPAHEYPDVMAYSWPKGFFIAPTKQYET